MLLEVSQLSCQKGERTLFEKLSFSVDAGQAVQVTGENGAGKTSLLRIVVGLSQAATGTVKITKENAALIFQGHKAGLNDNLSALENLRFWCQQRDIQVDTSSIMQTLEHLGLGLLEDLPVKSLSAGQQRRVGLARLWLHQQAKLWVLDEPFTALDVNLIAALEEKMQSFVAQGGAILFTSHQAPQQLIPSHTVHLEYQL